jgi:hypothetical protein
MIRHVAPLPDLQYRILTLLDLPVSIYEHFILPNEPVPPECPQIEGRISK